MDGDGSNCRGVEMKDDGEIELDRYIHVHVDLGNE